MEPTKPPRKTQLNIRASALTIQQLEWLQREWNTSITETITVIIDRAYRQEQNPTEGCRADLARQHERNRMMDAKHLSPEAKAICKAQHMTPREFEVVNSNKPASASGPDDPEYVVLRVWNSRRTIEITNHDMAYATMYLR